MTVLFGRVPGTQDVNHVTRRKLWWEKLARNEADRGIWQSSTGSWKYLLRDVIAGKLWTSDGIIDRDIPRIQLSVPPRKY